MFEQTKKRLDKKLVNRFLIYKKVRGQQRYYTHTHTHTHGAREIVYRDTMKIVFDTMAAQNINKFKKTF